MIVINITNYNQSKYIPQLFNSLLPQIKGADDVQVNWVDDCSTDNSVEVASQHPIALLPNVKIIKHKTNKWVSSSRNESITKLGEEDWITFIDGDDYVKNNYIDTLRSFVQDNQYDVYTFDYDNVCDIPEVDVRRILKCENIMVWTRLYRGSFILHHKIKFRNKPYREMGYGEDGAFNEEVMKAGAREKVVPYSIYMYRWGVEGSLSNTHKERNDE